MRVFEKRVIPNVGKTQNVTFNAFALQRRVANGANGSLRAGKDVLLGDESINGCFYEGALQQGVGTQRIAAEDGAFFQLNEQLPLPSQFFCYLQKDEQGNKRKVLGYVSNSGEVFTYQKSSEQWMGFYEFDGRMKCLGTIDEEEEEVLIFAGKAGVYASCPNKSMVQIFDEASLAACVFQGRVFCVEEPCSVRYSAPYNPLDFTASMDDGGRICFPSGRGKIVALLPFQNQVFVFYEYGIGKLGVAGSARDFCFETLEYEGGKIFGESVAACSLDGEKVFFLAEDGLYVFNGKTARRVCENLNVNPSKAKQIFHQATGEGKYFIRFLDHTGAQRCIVVDAQSEEGYYCFAYEGLSACNGNALCYEDGFVQRLVTGGEMPLGQKVEFTAHSVTFGINGKKTLKALTFEGDGVATLRIDNGRRYIHKTLRFSSGKARARVWMRGEQFSLSFTLERGAYLRSMTAEVAHVQ